MQKTTEKAVNPNITQTVTLQSGSLFMPPTFAKGIPAYVLGQRDLHSRIICAVLPNIAIKTNKNNK